MPNQPKTPVRSFRIDDGTMAKLDQLKAGSETSSEAIRKAIDSMHAFVAATSGLPEGISLEAMAAAEGVSVDAVEAADEASWINVHMPTPEANRRLLKALTAAAPFMTETARHDERQRTLRDVIVRLESLRADQGAIDHLKSLLD